MSGDATHGGKQPMGLLMLGAIGIVFGDIGTSPLYTMRALFTGRFGVPLTHDNVLGLLSVIFWSLVIVVTLKYATLIMRADNRGEAGARQVDGARLALQHNVGLGGACVVTLYERADR